jgi:hypothetical protein
MVIEPWIAGLSVIVLGIVVFVVLAVITTKTNHREEVENGTEHSEEH